MSVSTELLNTTLADLKGPLVNAFAQETPLIAHLEKKGQVSTEKGTYIERSIMGGSPAKATGIYGGGETLSTVRTEQTKKYQVEPHRVVAAISIPKKEMIANSGKKGAIKLIKEYPVAFIEGYNTDLERFLLDGVSAGIGAAATAELQGFLTFNGQKTSGRGTGVTNGLIDFAATGSQTDTVQNVAKSTSYFHYNQFGTVTSYAADGDRVTRKVYRQCAQYAKRSGTAASRKGPDIILADDDSFGNYTLNKKDVVRLVKVGDKTDDGNMLVDTLGLGEMVACQSIVLADFTGDALNGVIYYVNSDFWEWLWFQKPELSDFEDRIANQDAVIAKFECMGGHILTKFPAHGAVVGAAQA